MSTARTRVGRGTRKIRVRYGEGAVSSFCDDYYSRPILHVYYIVMVHEICAGGSRVPYAIEVNNNENTVTIIVVVVVVVAIIRDIMRVTIIIRWKHSAIIV